MLFKSMILYSKKIIKFWYKYLKCLNKCSGLQTLYNGASSAFQIFINLSDPLHLLLWLYVYKNTLYFVNISLHVYCIYHLCGTTAKTLLCQWAAAYWMRAAGVSAFKLVVASVLQVLWRCSVRINRNVEPAELYIVVYLCFYTHKMLLLFFLPIAKCPVIAYSSFWITGNHENIRFQHF
jgi:hypothetical protein